MSSHSFPLGIQSWSLRCFRDNAVAAGKLREMGADRVELCDLHGRFDDPAAFSEALAHYRAAGVSVVAFGVQTFEGKESERGWFERAAEAGARYLAGQFRPDTFLTAIPKVRRWSAEFGIRVGIHCHGGGLFGGQPEVLDYLLALGVPEIGVCIDTAWAMQIGPGRGNPVEWVKRYAGRVYGVHFKDFVFARNGQWEDVIPGEGNLDLPGFVAALKEDGFDGVAVVEYEAEVDDPLPMLKRSFEAVRAATG